MGVLCGLAMLAARPAAGGPRAVVDGPTHDAGERVAGVPLEREFTVRNAGDAPLALSVVAAPPRVDASCDAHVAAGATGVVRVAIDTLALAGPSTVRVAVATDDAAAPRLELAVRLDVRHLVVAMPGKARFVSVRGAEPVTVVQTLEAVDGRPFRVRAVRSTVPGLAVTHPTGAPATSWRLALTLGREAAVGPLAGTAEIDLDHPRQPRLAIPVSGFVRPVIAVTPPRLAPRDASRPWRTTLHVRSFAEEPVTIRRATTGLPGVVLTVRVVEPGRVHAVDVEVPAGTRDGAIRLETSSAAEPVVEVAVVAPR